jgi:hypothetical protein
MILVLMGSILYQNVKPFAVPCTMSLGVGTDYLSKAPSKHLMISVFETAITAIYYLVLRN